ncbi:hypothetical protein HG536_0E01740 [Torulaspora globosa]|uniref:Uncharacterized protein n=1 Tax=Torulaspora globosa TaxID=48254 RepID=A0A7G3ZIC7_9SACH|nr:uncharacterized protein HG536_0E01740 [Torulaspora globosa]QLL33263.1 hypothetical protein HG536_0E01740 [Torulaspora globosa]
MLARFYSSTPIRPKSQPPSRHALLYSRWARPVGKVLMLSIGSYYSLMYLWEYLEKKELEYEKLNRV